MPGPSTRDDPYSYEPPSNFEHTPYPYPHEPPTQYEEYHRSARNYAEELDDLDDYQVS